MCVNTNRVIHLIMKQIKIDSLESLVNDCEDYLLHRYIPLHSYTGEEIIRQAIKEGYMMELFDRHYAN